MFDTILLNIPFEKFELLDRELLRNNMSNTAKPGKPI